MGEAPHLRQPQHRQAIHGWLGATSRERAEVNKWGPADFAITMVTGIFDRVRC
jgi:hypothetical protein